MATVLHSLIFMYFFNHSCIYFLVLMKYNLKLDSIQQYIHTHNPLTIRMKEGESCNIPFTEQSNEDYCYGHILSKQGEMLEQEVEKFVMFRNVNKNDSGVYELHPKHNGWNGLMQLILNVECKYEA